MGRKKKKDNPDAVYCEQCGIILQPNAPMLAMIYEWNGETKGVCCDCGHMGVRLFRIMEQRWG